MIEAKYDSKQRRIRANRHIRELAASVKLSHLDFVQPLFIDESVGERRRIQSLCGVSSETIDSAIRQIGHDLEQGISKFLIFPVPAAKADRDFDFSFITRAIRRIKEAWSDDVWLAVDVCLCSYTTHGHCGILDDSRSRVKNNETVQVLSGYALQLADAGADCIAPSDLMDGRVKAIRKTLDSAGFDHVAIMSYSAKFSSSYYGPFRDACKSAPGTQTSLKDRKTYQLSPYNSRDAVRSAVRDMEEGADIIMVKPALLNGDILCRVREVVTLPLAAYHVSGEYQSVELLANHGVIARDKGHLEVWASLKRAGADIIISYASRSSREWIANIEY